VRHVLHKKELDMNRRESRPNASPTGTSLDRIETQYLGFPLGDERFAVEILKIQEIRPLTAITPIPNAPEHIRGVINPRHDRASV
jgi:purine-binding chemotaxis protein CheW